MKKQLLLGIGLLLSAAGFSQTFTDNFDSYIAGQKLCFQSAGAWTTWSNAPGGTEDVNVIDTDASSPSNSLRFTSTASGGGPVDIVRHFGILNTGQFSMEFNIKIPAARAGYFNLQKTATMGQTQALDVFFKDNGTIAISQIPSFSAIYTQGTWFNFRLDINFNINKWEVFINDVSVGYFSNSVNQIEAIDLYPVDNDGPFNSDFYIDDFQTIITPYTLPAKNAAVTYAGFNGGNIATGSVEPTFKVRNLGVTTTITSFDIAANYNGTIINQSFTGLSMASLAEQSFTLITPIILVAGSNVLSYTVSNINHLGADDDAADDISTIVVNPIVPATGKMVVGEEGTGTWCQWCPRGAVYMDKFENDYSEFWAGIAVHNGDPMVVTEYDTGVSALINAAYPNALVDRGAKVDPSAMGPDFFSRLQTAPTAFIENGATWDPTTRMLYVSVTSDFQAAANNNYKIACVLTEDDVTGTTGYAQSNAYAGGGNGVMGGYELLPHPVPAAQMVYDHVARAIQPSFTGYANSFPATVAAGEIYTVNFLFILPIGWDANNIHIIGMLMAPNGRIDNAGKATITQAVANGFVSGTMASVEEMTMEQLDATFQIYPNPTSTNAIIAINLKKESMVALKLIDMSGKEIASGNYGTLNGSSTVELNTSALEAGVYLVELTVNNEKMIKRLIVE